MQSTSSPLFVHQGALAHTNNHTSSLALVLQAGLQTLSVQLGTKQVFWICIMLLEAAYLGAIGVGVRGKTFAVAN